MDTPHYYCFLIQFWLYSLINLLYWWGEDKVDRRGEGGGGGGGKHNIFPHSSLSSSFYYSQHPVYSAWTKIFIVILYCLFPLNLTRDSLLKVSATLFSPSHALKHGCNIYPTVQCPCYIATYSMLSSPPVHPYTFMLICFVLFGMGSVISKLPSRKHFSFPIIFMHISSHCYLISINNLHF